MITSISYRSIAPIVLLSFVCIFIWSFMPTKNNNATLLATQTIYCELYVRNKYQLDQKWHRTLLIDYGFNSTYTSIIIENNKVKELKSYLDALNYMSSRGWRLVATKRYTIDGNFDFEDYYILEKTIN